MVAWETMDGQDTFRGLPSRYNSFPSPTFFLLSYQQLFQYIPDWPYNSFSTWKATDRRILRSPETVCWDIFYIYTFCSLRVDIRTDSSSSSFFPGSSRFLTTLSSSLWKYISDSVRSVQGAFPRSKVVGRIPTLALHLRFSSPVSRPTLSQFWCFQIRRVTFPNCMKSSSRGSKICERAGRVTDCTIRALAVAPQAPSSALYYVLSYIMHTWENGT